MVDQKNISVGDYVMFTFGVDPVRARVVKDLGHIGKNGRRYLRLCVPHDPYEETYTEMPEEWLTLTDSGVRPISPEEVKEHMVNAGLIEILRSNMEGGKYQPRVWLGHDSLGNITHTFAEERGSVGGAIPPISAIWNSRIHKQKVDKVIEFLMTFGLSKSDAEEVVKKVGTAS